MMSIETTQTGMQNEVTAVRPSLSRVLADRGIASEDELRLAHAEGMGAGERLGEVVLRRGWLDEVGLAHALAQQWGVAFIGDEATVDRGALMLLDAATARELGVCPVEGTEGRLTIAVAEPTDERVTAVREATRSDPLLAVVTPETLTRLLEDAATPPFVRETYGPAVDEREVSEAVAEIETALRLATGRLRTVREQVTQLVTAGRQEQHELERLEVTVADLREALTESERQRAELQTRLDSLRSALNDAHRLFE
jgi:Type II secretion system (T2SS), protein E, N-terminal domain